MGADKEPAVWVGEPVVWVDEITPMTGPEVKALLEENETLRTKLRKAYEEADRKEEVQAFRCHLHSEEAREEGAAVAFGVVGMGEAIRQNAPRLVERYYWTSERDGQRYYDCFCPGCGVQIKGLIADKWEGTDYEWCGWCKW